MDISARLQYICEKLLTLDTKIGNLETQTKELGQACGKAFKQVKIVVEHLTEAVDGTRQDLAEYGGVIVGSTYDV